MSGRPPRAEDGPYEVLVLGGGVAGVAAAIAAAEEGARVALVERAGWLGGQGITGATGLHSFFNIFDPVPGAERMRVVGGVAQRLVDRTGDLGGAVGHVRLTRGGDFVSMLTPVEPEAFKLAAVQMCREAGVELMLHTVVDGVEASAGHVEAVTVWNKGGRRRLRAARYVDCTGDGDVAGEAGAPFFHPKPGDPGAYPAGFTFRLCNVDLAGLEAELDRRGLISQLAHAVKPGMGTPDLVRLGIDMRPFRKAGERGAPGYFLSSSLRPRELTYCNCINHGPNDGLDPGALTRAEVELRQAMFDIAAFFKRNFAACRDAYPAGPSPSAGQRRGRAIRCAYELGKEDCLEGRRFPDQIGCFSFIDNHKFFVKDAGAYGIPYRALVPEGLDNVLIAGRMMTVDIVAHNSTRNTACCMVCGQAAGTAAALSAGGNVTPGRLDAGALREALKRRGALLDPVPDPV